MYLLYSTFIYFYTEVLDGHSSKEHNNPAQAVTPHAHNSQHQQQPAADQHGDMLNTLFITLQFLFMETLKGNISHLLLNHVFNVLQLAQTRSHDMR